ncbi:Co2+/Mg2+ efflux protein ApaG [Aureivirga sp. CE67]|uniref:Co2+/Mg2+ efflux protein ApaG n=1 Tax=Aureivirga sp. CE67 TaxID=1788983 RepID=UPI0018CA57F0|nr:Co2+/Mg2+ efflux protein ApaG [Aureivirga sp. CE67]
MVFQVTNGIKISVKTEFESTVYRNYKLHYVFSYRLSIENQSNDTVQLLRRNWTIFDSLNEVEEVSGEGVIGEKPILKPKEKFTYKSHCILTSKIGAMKGHYEMINFTTTQKFNVNIPTFQLIVKGAIN